MKHSFASCLLILLLICLTLAVAGCGPITTASGNDNQIVGSGKLVTTGHELSGFNSISGASEFKLNVHQGDKFAVSTTVDDNVMPLVVVEKVGDELRLGVKPGSYNFRRVAMKADVTLPELKSVTLDSNASAQLDSFKSPSLALHTVSNGVAQGNVQVGKLLVDSGGNGQVRLSGTADDLTVRGQGNAVLTLDGLTAKTAFVDIGSNAKAGVKATEKLDYSVGGNAGLTYTGGAELGQQKTAGNAWARQR